MMSAITRFYGFHKPYRFDRVSAVFLGAAGLVIVGGIGLINIFGRGTLSWDVSARLYVYLAALYLGACLIAFLPRLSFLLLVFAIAETSLSLGLNGYGRLAGREVQDWRFV